MPRISYPDGLSRDEWIALVEERRNPFYLEPATREQRIWRYLSFAKFVSLLESRALFFSSAAILPDAFEGSASKANIRQRPLLVEELVAALASHDVGRTINREELSRGFTSSLAALSAQLLWERSWTFINCWHMSDVESDAMWRLYTSTPEGLAIQSTYARLDACMRPKRVPPMAEPIVATVRYIDYDEDIIQQNVHLSHYFYKRQAYSHEKEIRAVFQDLPLIPILDDQQRHIASHFDVRQSPPPGKLVPVDLDLLVEAIHVAPSAPVWIHELTRAVMLRYGLNKPLYSSALEQRPVY